MTKERHPIILRHPEFLAILLFLAVDTVWSSILGINFIDYGRILAATSGLLLIGSYYGFSGRSERLAEMGYYGAAWISFSATGAVLTYLAAYMRTPLYDSAFAEIDAALGFSWPIWFELGSTNVVIDLLLRIAYHSLIFQILGSIIFFAHTKRTDRNKELFWAAAISLAITSAIAYAYPAVGAFYHFKIEVQRAVHLQHVFDLIAGTQPIYSFRDMQGIVTFPSYHAALAVIFMYVYRGFRRAFPFAVALNTFMLISTPANGGHYLIDVIAGSVVAAVSVLLLRHAAPRLSRSTLHMRLVPQAASNPFLNSSSHRGAADCLSNEVRDTR
ncbi:phosphatase PAP2 family protein [Aromatoleum toluclasticum]|uniref:phosphatase PAP2 family protein n=1 Tax=Aromatoleum toluclasticum TaxID=92003 RepID=UPI0012F71DB0|nr:phosphatase PAP2 family protein [Aromatoleum toluclasticum]